MRLWTRLLMIVALLAAGLFTWMHHEARADPIVRRATIGLPDWPAGQAPITVLLLGDVHIGSAAMDAPRLTRIVAQINALKPDLVLMAGDFVFGHDAVAGERYAARLVKPLSALRAPLGVVAVPGNHDYWAGEVSVPRALWQANVTLLVNSATVRGPLAIGGVADVYTHHAQVQPTMHALDRLPGAKIVVTHSPDVTTGMPGEIALVLAAHTHCGQIVAPFYGPLSSVARERYRCGIVRDGQRLTVVTAGLGTSSVPFRFGAPPDMWLLTLGPRRVR
jgi:predicted MPP superfamily phosphohydrolase